MLSSLNNPNKIYIIYYFNVASGFLDVCPSGSIDRQSIADIYAMPRRNAEKFIEQMFKMFDRDGDGKISFRVGLMSDF